MSPEERRRGALIDHRTSVFVLGRVLAVFLAESRRTSAVNEVLLGATMCDPAARPGSVAELHARWRATVAG